MVGAASQPRASLHNSTDRGWEAAPTKILQMPTIKSAGLLIFLYFYRVKFNCVPAQQLRQPFPTKV